ncbi:MAG: hypothetical protein A2736_00040 [Candidatus Yanofskybacteria bacterium RIFCSPHIGHO2_01_FULL_41_27]|uniref:Uncharacterized protein n=3 Tax=Parcubacteria group TaxID=1794811 RepID=A0A1F8HUY2_9BACT|nr:MAG: hypothetical protein UU83_C0027G0012 [Candidatus Jorgensenbacteria bacterium GW2011_GWF2_41_8]KKT16781.1 MAG: hypothetical protein UV98_C0022G0004 [Parcubacteria group bacterium GW2011_GWB1_43_6]OGM99430.1 MAG: hypothetical protein A2736_00040 [Candidatus Yanofskybacteria bacterium RIFCSPHIGHO2_01_FULL_41_27]OGN20876.1 MAG: hypothetical protein A3B00_01800 [Candidatus Yanofskybacteria bacterium RIFCSPLOWO2_01_FULL_41_33]OGN41387.1 MAG: hypothetical protein A2606_01275 [Candidatus Yanofs
MDKILSFFSLSYFSKLNLNFSPGMLFAGLILVALLLYGLSLGRTKAMVSFLGVYIAYAVQSVFPFWDKLDEIIKFAPQPHFTRIGFFLILYFLIFLVLNISLVKSRLTIGEASFFAVSVISVLQLGLLLAIILNMLPISEVAKILPASLAQYFVASSAIFYWFIAPIPAMLLVRKGHDRD